MAYKYKILNSKHKKENALDKDLLSASFKNPVSKGDFISCDIGSGRVIDTWHMPEKSVLTVEFK